LDTRFNQQFPRPAQPSIDQTSDLTEQEIIDELRKELRLALQKISQHNTTVDTLQKRNFERTEVIKAEFKSLLDIKEIELAHLILNLEKARTDSEPSNPEAFITL
jgi:hypothetical protein